MLRTDNFLSFSILLITLASITQWTSLPIGNTFLWWGINGSILLVFLKGKSLYFDEENKRYITAVLIYAAWNIVCIIRGIGVAENYWEWKFLVTTSMVLLLPVSIYVSTNPGLVQKITGTWIRIALPAFFLFLPFFAVGDAIGRYLVPVSFLLLFFPLLPSKWKIIALILTVVVIVGAPAARSNVIKFSVCLMLGLLFYFRNSIPQQLMQGTRLSFLFLPIILFYLAVSGKFNVFRMDEYVGEEYTTTVVENGEVQEESLTTDTRTPIYEEVLASALKYDYVWLGRTPARGNESFLFGEFVAEQLRTGKMERFSNEVSILNIFTWTGLLGVILYFFVFLRASFLAVNHSNNMFIQIVGLYVAFRWTYAWIEDFSDFDLSYFYLWIMIGMCFSKGFRRMDNTEFRYWLLGIIDKRYRTEYSEPGLEGQDENYSLNTVPGIRNTVTIS